MRHHNHAARTDLVRGLVRPAVNAVVRNVQSTLGEPLNVSSFERSSLNSRVRAVPVEFRDEPSRSARRLCDSSRMQSLRSSLTSRCAPWPSVQGAKGRAQGVRELSARRVHLIVPAMHRAAHPAFGAHADRRERHPEWMETPTAVTVARRKWWIAVHAHEISPASQPGKGVPSALQPRLPPVQLAARGIARSPLSQKVERKEHNVRGPRTRSACRWIRGTWRRTTPRWRAACGPNRHCASRRGA